MPELDRLIIRDSTGTQNFGNTAVNIPRDTTIRADPAYTVNGSGTRVTFNETHYYLVMGQLGAEFSGGVGGTRGQYRTQWFSSQVGGVLLEGRATGYSRNAQAADDGATQCSAFIRQFSQGTYIEQQVLQTDNDTLRLQVASNAFTRGGLQILALPDVDSHLRLSGTTDNPTSTTGFQTMTWESQLDIDTDVFGHSTSTDPDEITLKQAGHYFVCYNWNAYNPTGTGGRFGARSLLQLNGSNVPATNVHNQLRDANNIVRTTVGFAGIIETGSANQVLTLAYRKEQGTNVNFQPEGGGARRIMIWKMNDGADYFRVRGADSGTAPGADTTTILPWNETDELDASFSRPAAAEFVDMATDDSILWFTNLRTTHDAAGSNQRIQHRIIPRINGFGQQIGCAVSYERNTPGDGSSNQTQSGACIASLTDDLSDGDRLSVQHANLASTSDSTAVLNLSQSSWTGVAISTLTADAPPPEPVVTKSRKHRVSRPGLARGLVSG